VSERQVACEQSTGPRLDTRVELGAKAGEREAMSEARPEDRRPRPLTHSRDLHDALKVRCKNGGNGVLGQQILAGDDNVGAAAEGRRVDGVGEQEDAQPAPPQAFAEQPHLPDLVERRYEVERRS
jgi:hypothetical protein